MDMKTKYRILFVIICIFNLFALVWVYKQSQKDAWESGYKLGWYDHLNHDEFARNMVCARYWEYQHKTMLKDKTERESKHGLREVYKH